MASDQSPFFASKIECPVCGNLNSFEIIKQGSYTESGKDTDFAPLGREWANPDFQRHNPLLYFTGTCSNCYYTREIKSAYKNWQQDASFKTYRLPNQRKKHLNELAASRGIVKRLGGRIDYNNYPDESAIIKLLLAIYDELLLDRPVSLDVARFYLRIAWIFREMDGETGDRRLPERITANKMQNEISNLIATVESIEERLPRLTNLVDREIETLASQDRIKDDIAARVKTALGEAKESWTDFSERVAGFQTRFEDAIREFDKDDSESESSGVFGENNSFREYLYEIKELWQDIPVSETDALRLALQYYLQAYQNSKEIKSGLPQLQASYMIGELYRRIGDDNAAMEYFKNTSKHAHEMMNRNRNDRSVFANSQKILEMSMTQARLTKKPESVKA